MSDVQLTDEDLREFCEIWKEEFGETITVAQARERASQLLELVELVSVPLPSSSSEQERSTPQR